MKNKKVIILIILGVVAIFSLIYGISTPAGGRRSASVSTTPEVTRQSESAQVPDRTMGIKRRAKRTKFVSWSRSPFIPKGVPGTPSSGLNLKGIMWNEKNPKAMIGDAIVEKGNKIGSDTVIEVKKDRVILNDGTKDFELKLKE